MSDGKTTNGADRSRSARVTASRALAMAERAAMARGFRERLTREIASDGTIAQEMLIQSAASAATEVSVLTTRFLACSATATQLDRLGRARSELSRTLRLLGIAPKSAGELTGAADLKTWLERRRQRKKVPDGQISADLGAAGEEVEP